MMHDAVDDAVRFHLPELLDQHLLRDGGDRTLEVREPQEIPAEEMKSALGWSCWRWAAAPASRPATCCWLACRWKHAAWNRCALARRIAYLPQYTPAAEGLTVRELVALGRYPWHGALGRFSAEDRRMVDVALGLAEMGRYADRLVERLSGGERQRAWLAMLLAQDARCLLLDEPISALDLRHQMELLTLIRRLNQQHGISVILVIHDVNMAARFCDDILALHSGRLIMRGGPAVIMRPEQLETIYGVPFDSVRDPRSGRDICFVP